MQLLPSVGCGSFQIISDHMFKGYEHLHKSTVTLGHPAGIAFASGMAT